MCRCRSTTSAIEPAQRRPPPTHPSTMTAPRTLRQQPTAGRALAALCGALWLLPSAGHAQSVTPAGMLGSKALLVVDANPPRAVGVGEQYQGGKVIATTKEEATVEIRGVRRTPRAGAAGGAGGGGGRRGRGKRITLIADSRGHFVNSGTINGQVMQFMIDTGASTVAVGRTDADRMGLKYKNGHPIRMNNA